MFVQEACGGQARAERGWSKPRRKQVQGVPRVRGTNGPLCSVGESPLRLLNFQLGSVRMRIGDIFLSSLISPKIQVSWSKKQDPTHVSSSIYGAELPPVLGAGFLSPPFSGTWTLVHHIVVKLNLTPRNTFFYFHW